MRDDNIKYWFSLDNGVHIPVKEGESKREAVGKVINKRMSRVEKNKSMYDKIDNFKKKKRSNIEIKKTEEKKIEKKPKKQSNIIVDDNGEEFGKKAVGLSNRNNVYIPIREGDETGNKAVDKYYANERDMLYNRIAENYGEEYNKREAIKRARETGRFGELTGPLMEKEAFNLTSKEGNEYVKDKLDKVYKEARDKDEKLTKEQVRGVIEEYRNKKMSNQASKVKPTNDSDIARLESDKDFLEKEMSRQKEGREFLMSSKEKSMVGVHSTRNLMTSEEQRKYNDLKSQYEAVKEKLNNSWANGKVKAIDRNTSVEQDVIKPFGSSENFVRSFEKMYRDYGDKNLYETADRFVRQGNYANTYQEARDYYEAKFYPRDKQLDAFRQKIVDTENPNNDYKFETKIHEDRDEVLKEFYITNMAHAIEKAYRKYKRR